MNDLEVYGKNKAEIESLVWTVKLIIQDTGMKFGIKTCGAEARKFV